MPQQYQVRFVQIPRWLAIVASMLAVAFAVALFLLSLTVFLVMLPVILLAGAIYYFFGLPRAARDRRRPHDVEVIEAEYRVVETDKNDEERR